MRKRSKVARPVSEDVSELTSILTDALNAQIAKLKEDNEALQFQITEASVAESGLKQQLRDKHAVESELLHIRAERDTLRNDLEDLRAAYEMQAKLLGSFQVRT